MNHMMHSICIVRTSALIRIFWNIKKIFEYGYAALFHFGSPTTREYQNEAVTPGLFQKFLSMMRLYKGVCNIPYIIYVLRFANV